MSPTTALPEGVEKARKAASDYVVSQMSGYGPCGTTALLENAIEKWMAGGVNGDDVRGFIEDAVNAALDTLPATFAALRAEAMREGYEQGRVACELAVGYALNPSNARQKALDSIRALSAAATGGGESRDSLVEAKARSYDAVLAALESAHNRALPFGQVLADLGLDKPPVDPPVLMRFIGPFHERSAAK